MDKWMKFLSMLLLVSVLLTMTSVFAADIRVAIDEEYIDFDVPPQMINSRTMVPLRAIFEALGAEVFWDGDTRTVTATKDEVIVVATIGNTTMYVDDEVKTMDIAPMIIENRTLVPVRFVAEAFGCEVEWDGDNRIVNITSEEANFYYADQD